MTRGVAIVRPDTPPPARGGGGPRHQPKKGNAHAHRRRANPPLGQGQTLRPSPPDAVSERRSPQRHGRRRHRPRHRPPGDVGPRFQRTGGGGRTRPSRPFRHHGLGLPRPAGRARQAGNLETKAGHERPALLLLRPALADLAHRRHAGLALAGRRAARPAGVARRRRVPAEGRRNRRTPPGLAPQHRSHGRAAGDRRTATCRNCWRWRNTPTSR